MFGLVYKQNNGIAVNSRTNQVMIFKTEESAWRVFLSFEKETREKLEIRKLKWDFE